MTKRKFKSYTLWIKWYRCAWGPELTCTEPTESTGFANPITVLEERMAPLSNSPYWKRGKNWMILPEGKKPTNAL